jgi:hypothetical protein
VLHRQHQLRRDEHALRLQQGVQRLADAAVKAVLDGHDARFDACLRDRGDHGAVGRERHELGGAVKEQGGLLAEGPRRPEIARLPGHVLRE